MKIRSLVLVSSREIVSMVRRRHVISCGAHVLGNAGLWVSSISSVVIHVLGWRCIPMICHPSIEVVLVSSDVSVSGCYAYAIGSGSFGLGFWNFGGSFLVSLCFLQLKNPFLKWSRWVLIFKLVIFNTLDDCL